MDRESMNTILLNVLPDVRSIAAMELRPGACLDDMAQAGWIRVWRKLDRGEFDPARGSRLMSFAYQAVRQAARIEAIRRSSVRLTVRGNFRDRVEVDLNVRPLGGSIPESVADVGLSFEDREWCASAIGFLDPCDADMMRLLYGFHPDGPLSLRQVAMRLGLSYSTAERRRNGCLAMLRSMLNQEDIS